jgi:hypothetical protein
MTYSVGDDVWVFPLCRVTEADFEQFAAQDRDGDNPLVGYPFVVSESGKLWPKPIEGVEVHATEGSYLKPFFLIRRDPFKVGKSDV